MSDYKWKIYSFIVSLLSKLIVPFILVKLVNPSDSGAWFSLVAALNVLSFTQFGMPVIIQRRAAYLKSANTIGPINYLIDKYRLKLALSSIVVFSVVALLSVKADYLVLIVILSSYVFLISASSLIEYTFNGIGDYLSISKINFQHDLLLLLFQIVLILIFPNIISLSFAYLFTALFKYYLLRYRSKFLSETQALNGKRDPEFEKLFLRDSFKEWLPGLSSFLLNRTDLILVSSIFGLVAVNEFYAHSIVGALLLGVLSSMSAIFVPKYTISIADGNNKKALMFFTRIFILFGLAVVFAGLVGIFFGEWLLLRWMNIAFDIELFILFLLIVLFDGMGRLFYAYITANNALVFHKQAVVLALINIILSLFFLKFWGIKGILYATLFCHFSFGFIYGYYQFKRLKNYNGI